MIFKYYYSGFKSAPLIMGALTYYALVVNNLPKRVG